jgi:hypothetical protein
MHGEMKSFRAAPLNSVVKALKKYRSIYIYFTLLHYYKAKQTTKNPSNPADLPPCPFCKLFKPLFLHSTRLFYKRRLTLCHGID